MRYEINYSLKNLKSRKLRSSLSILSILIGIAAIFALVSFGMGIQDYVNRLSAEMGSDKLFIMAKGIGAPGMDESFFITTDEVDFVGRISGVDEATGLYMKVAEIKSGNENKFNFIMGLDPEKMDFINEGFAIGIQKGRGFRKGDDSKVVLGYNYQIGNKPSVFGKPLELGDRIKINGEDFEVIGFYEEVGSPQDDSQIYVTFEAFEKLYPARKDKFGYVILSSAPGADTGALAEKIKEKLGKRKGQEEGKEDFDVQSLEDVLEIYGSVINAMSGALVLIALMSVVVAFVNTMNTMYTAVLDRTAEIGTMKAIGARNENILFIFVFEAAFLGFAGGAIGIVLGYIISSAAGAVAAGAGYSMLQPVFPLYLTAGCLIFSVIVGAFSGLLPAIMASKLDPVEALRYE